MMLRYREKRARRLIRKALRAEAEHQAMHEVVQRARLRGTVLIDPETPLTLHHDRDSTVMSIAQRVLRMHHRRKWTPPRRLNELIEEVIDAAS